MPKQEHLKARIRERMAKTGESYTAARRHIVDAPTPSHEAEQLPSVQRWSASRRMMLDQRDAQALLERALRREPRLSRFGIGEHEEMRRPGEDDAAAFARERASLSVHLDEILLASEWVVRQRPTRKFNKLRSSYGLKHAVERWAEWRGLGAGPGHRYVANGSLIAAALGLGYDALDEHGTPNVFFRFHEETIERPMLDHHAILHIVRPDGTQEIVRVLSLADLDRAARRVLAAEPVGTTASGLVSDQWQALEDRIIGGYAYGEWLRGRNGIEVVSDGLLGG